SISLIGEAGASWHSELAWICPPDDVLHTGSLPSGKGPRDAWRAALEEVLRSGASKILTDVDVPYPRGNADAAEFAQGRSGSARIFPLLARGQILGALTLAQNLPARQFGPTEQFLAEELAARAAVALDNARLYRDIQEVDRRKSEFLAMLAHELRNPLAPIR